MQISLMPFNLFRNRRRAGGAVPDPGDGGGDEFAYDFLDVYTSDESTAQRVFTGVGFGDPHPTREIVVGLAWTGGGNSGGATSVTIGGVSATLDARFEGNFSSRAELWRALVPDDDHADANEVAITMPAAQNRWIIGVHRLTNRAVQDAAPSDNAANQGSGSRSVTIDIPTGGAAIAVAHREHSQEGTLVLSGVTQAYDVSPGSGSRSVGGGDLFPDGETGHQIHIESFFGTSLAAASYL